MLYEILMVSYLVVAIALVAFVLIQQGKGADMGASFGAGGSNTVFGSSGSGNFMTRTTAILATLFFFISLMIGSMSVNDEVEVDSFQNIDIPVEEFMPLEPAVPSDIPTDIPNLETLPAMPETGADLPEVLSDIPDVSPEEVTNPDTPN